MKSNAAYDLSAFETAEPRVRVVKTEKAQKEKTNGAKAIKRRMAAAFVFIVALMCVSVYNHVMLSETQSKINAAQNQLTKLESSYDCLNIKLDDAVSLKEAEDYAVNELGMVKLDRSQIVYVNLRTENAIEDGEVSPTALTAVKTALGAVEGFLGF